MSIVEKTPLSKRLLPFDGMRGIACALIICYHINPNSLVLCWAWTLVDLFFIISGFLIGSIIYRGLRDGNLLLKNFWMRRVLRVWPVYYMTLGVVLALSFAFSEFRGHDVALKDILRSLVFMQFTGGYLHPGANWNGIISNFVPWFAHSWSIAAEEQFYVLMPLTLLVVGIATRRIFLLTLIGVILGETLLYSGFVPGLLGTRLQGLGLGLLLAPLSYWLAERPETGSRKRSYALWMFATSFVLGCAIMGPVFSKVIPSMLHGGTLSEADGLAQARHSILGMVLLYFAFAGYVLAFPFAGISRFLATSIPVYLGSVSYALYMFHVPVEGMFTALMGRSLYSGGIVIWAAYWVVVLGLAHLSKIFVENYFNGLKDRFPVYRRDRQAAPATDTAVIEQGAGLTR